MSDKFRDTPRARNHPAGGLFAVVPNDGADLTHVAQYFRVGGVAGDVRVISRNGDDVVIPNVQVGETIPGEIKRIMATNTTATGITAFYS